MWWRRAEISAKDYTAARQGDVGARNRIVEANMPLVVHIANGMGTGERLDDLIQEGSRGLMRAAEKFEVDRGIAFSTYAYRWVQIFISRYLCDARTIRLPHASLQKYRRTMKRKEKLSKMGWDMQRALKLRVSGLENQEGKPLPVAAPVTEGEVDDLANLAAALTKLSPRERHVLEGRYWRGMRLEDVGREVGVTRERVRQIQMEAEGRLRELLADNCQA